jgi:large subunit ribosomal protein L18
MGKPEEKNAARKIRQRRVRRKVQGTPERPRLSVFRSAKHIYAQVVDDTANRVLVAASSLSQDFRGPSGLHCREINHAGKLTW